jgi:hypothetical protein
MLKPVTNWYTRVLKSSVLSCNSSHSKLSIANYKPDVPCIGGKASIANNAVAIWKAICSSLQLRPPELSYGWCANNMIQV